MSYLDDESIGFVYPMALLKLGMLTAGIDPFGAIVPMAASCSRPASDP